MRSSRRLQVSSIAATGAVLLFTAMFTSCAGKSVSSTGSGTSGVPLVGTYRVNPFTFSNGLKLLVVEDHSSPTLAYQTWFRVGSRNEVINRTGLAHLFEHMMFKGTTAYPEGQYEHVLEQAGAEGLNAFTTQDYTAYIQEIPSDKLELLAKLESDRMVNLVVNEQSFRTELGVVQNERRFRNENNPDGTIEQELFGLAFKKHPYHWPVVGYQEDLDRMSAEDARKFYQDFYNPSHATIIIVGDVTPEHARDVVQKFYGGLQAKASPTHDIPVEPAQKETRRKVLNLNIQVQKLMVGYRVPPLVSSDAPKLEVLASILAGGKSSRLNRALVDTGIASSVEASNPGSEDPSAFEISVNLQKGKKAAQAEAVITREVQRLMREPVSDREMERVQNRLSFDFYTSLSSSYEKARFLGYFDMTAGSFEKGIQYRKEVSSVKPADVQAIVRAYFTNDNRTIITALPKAAARTK